jgi:glycosyltransferase involved in cell wall biosynthesis
MISLLDLPTLFRMKPAVWTFHDPWPMTGHCVHPLECDRWLTGCGGCPSLDTVFPLADDCADRMWRLKQTIYSELDADIVVASEFMRDMVRQSPLTHGFDRVHLIPFGIDRSKFLPQSEKVASRQALGIPEDDFVVFSRASTQDFKGTRYLVEALAEGPPTRPTTLLTVDERGLLRSLRCSYNVRDLGWVDNPSRYARALSACDVFVMPSTAEAFGLMALEAMAAGRPVICFEETALPSITHAPECGIAVPMGDSSALRAAIDRLSQHPEEAQRRGELSRITAVEFYDYERYLDAMASLYLGVAART